MTVLLILIGTALVVAFYKLHHLQNRIWVLEKRVEGVLRPFYMTVNIVRRLDALELKSGVGEAKFSGTSYTSRPPLEKGDNCGGSVPTTESDLTVEDKARGFEWK